MSTLEEYEKKGLFDLFTNNNQALLLNLSNSLVVNKLIVSSSAEDALNTLLLHGGGALSILSKKLITKEILFKYLHNSNVPVNKNCTKITLIEKVLEYWKIKFKDFSQEVAMEDIECIENERELFRAIRSTAPVLIQNNFYMIANNNERLNNETESFPVNKLAIQFSEWFFKRFNRVELKLDDFWSDARLLLRILNVQTNSIEDSQNLTCSEVLSALFKVKQTYGFLFNPNICHKGCQGRIDQHGLVLVLCCGTLQKSDSCVGIFESTFSLARDLTTENNWKIRELKLFLNNVNTASLPSLETCETLKDIFLIPQTDCSLN